MYGRYGINIVSSNNTFSLDIVFEYFDSTGYTPGPENSQGLPNKRVFDFDSGIVNKQDLVNIGQVNNKNLYRKNTREDCIEAKNCFNGSLSYYYYEMPSDNSVSSFLSIYSNDAYDNAIISMLIDDTLSEEEFENALKIADKIVLSLEKAE